ncbi:MAG: hypothetical protein V2I27_00255 [Erythrobacter sp.]|jgi:hypothetical protein|nr:hypothetical protein [Erythrobacter sp.]
MKLDPKTIANAERAIAALDFSEANAAIRALEAEMASVENAQKATSGEIRALSQAIREFSGPEAEKVADAILSGSRAAEAATLGVPESELRDRRAALQAAAGELERRRERARKRLAEVREAAVEKSAKALQPLVDEIMREATRAANTLLAAYAAASALHSATRKCGDAQIVTRAGAVGVAGFQKILPHSSGAEAPGEVLALLDKLGRAAPFPVRPAARVRI